MKKPLEKTGEWSIDLEDVVLATFHPEGGYAAFEISTSTQEYVIPMSLEEFKHIQAVLAHRA